jgi:hypothetical protein
LPIQRAATESPATRRRDSAVNASPSAALTPIVKLRLANETSSTRWYPKRVIEGVCA